MGTTRSTKSLRFAEFFAGIGLMRIGMESARGSLRCVFSNDFDQMKRSIYRGHFGEEPDGSDVHALPAESVPTVDLATASFPCTDLSLAGFQRGIRSGQSSAFWGFHRVLSEMGERRPRAVLLENVVGLLDSHSGRDFHDLLLAMNDLGYAVDPLVIDARWFVPQSRARLFVVCLKADLASRPPDLLVPQTRLRPAKLTQFMISHSRDIRWATQDLPEPPQSSDKTLRDVVHELPADHPAWWSSERVEYLYGQMFERHQAWVDEHLDSRGYSYATAFRRVRPVGDGKKRSMAELRTDGIAGCLRTPKGGSGRQILVRAGRGAMRARLLTGRECAALMGAEEYRLICTENQALFGFGDAVCVNAVRWLADNYIVPVLAAGRPASYSVHRHERAAVPA